MINIRELTGFLEDFAPLSSQAGFDNCGLLVGDPSWEVSGVLVTLDCIESVVDEAIALGANIIVAHHPIVFSGLKKLNGKSYIERTVLKAIKNDIAIYAIHTNLDHHIQGVNDEIANRLGLINKSILQPNSGVLNKLAVFVPKSHVYEVENALFSAGAGTIGNYEECSFRSEGLGSFKPKAGAKPHSGKIAERSEEEEVRLEVLVSTHRMGSVQKALRLAHPYEEIAYDIYPLLNVNQDEGSGMIGELEEEMDALEFLTFLKAAFEVSVVRHTALLGKKIKKVALCGGSGSFLLPDAKRQGADIYVSADFKYHEFFDAENDLIIADIGHYESEQFTTNLLVGKLKEKFTKFAIHRTCVNTNPIKYF